MKIFFKKIARTYRGEESGFTLIELLIVIVILGVLAAAIIPNLSKFVGSGTVGAANAELATIKTAVSAYASDYNGAYPTAASSSDGWSAQYITGGVKGVYTIDTSGLVTGTSYPSCTWDTTNLKWAK